MVSSAAERNARWSGYSGLVVSADEYLSLTPDGNRYELIHGVVVWCPSPPNTHQLVALEIIVQLARFVEDRGLGIVLPGADVVLEARPDKRGIVYRPDMHFVRAERVAGLGEVTRIVPDVVPEVISPESRGADEETKYREYEAAGVGEYWLVDPIDEAMTFFRLQDGKYIGAPVGPDHYESAAVPGFRLDLAKVRAAFRALK